MRDDLKIGQIVRVKAGREKQTFMVIVGFTKDCVYLANGRNRTIQKPKLKKMLHIARTNTVLAIQSSIENGTAKDSEIVKSLKQYTKEEGKRSE